MSANELLTQALKLPPVERQAFAEQLWQSLSCQGEETDTLPIPMEPEYVIEFKRRVESVRSGKYESVSFAECKEQVWKEFRERDK